MPKVSVLMPVYNTAKFLDESISSILNQTFTDFEFLILDDASSDNSLAIIKKYQKKDNRIKIFQNKTNKKEAESRNFLMSLAKADFIAWMDADDFSDPRRIEVQYNFLNKNSEIDILGGVATVYKDNFKSKPQQYINHPLKDNEIKTQLLLIDSALANPTTMIRLKKIKKYKIGYNPYYISATDYNFWVDCAPYCKFTNLNETLIKYRLHSKQISQNYKLTRKYRLEIVEKHLKRFQISMPKILLNKESVITYSFLLELKNFFYSICSIKNFYGYKSVKKEVIYKFFYSNIYRKLGIKGKMLFIKSYGWKNYFKVKTW